MGEEEGSKGWARGTRSEQCVQENKELQGAVSTARPEKKSFYIKLRLESREVCLPVKTFMLHDRMKMAILQRKCVKTLQDSRLGVFCLFF